MFGQRHAHLAEPNFVVAIDSDFRLTYALNAGHTDGKVTNQTLPDALVWLWQDYPIMKK